MRNGKGYRLNRKLKPLLLVSREEWGALPPRVPTELEGELQPIEHPVPRVIISYSEDPMCNDIEECKQNLKNIQRKHMEEGYTDIKYNFLVGGDGNVYEGRGWPYKPAKHGFWPEWYGESYEISHMGFHGINLPMYMSKAAWDTIELGISKNFVIEEGPIFPDLWRAYYDGLVVPYVKEENVEGQAVDEDDDDDEGEGYDEVSKKEKTKYKKKKDDGEGDDDGSKREKTKYKKKNVGSEDDDEVPKKGKPKYKKKK